MKKNRDRNFRSTSPDIDFELEFGEPAWWNPAQAHAAFEKRYGPLSFADVAEVGL